MLKKLLLAIIAGAWTFTVCADEPRIELPDIGSSAAEAISPQEERQYGASMLHQLRTMALIEEDPLTVDYLQSLGYRLVAASDRPEQNYTFFVVQLPEINAFAAPGGFIGIQTGLILTAETESELCAVLAHEIAHISQRHLIRAFESAKKASIPIALAILGAVIAAQGSNGDAGQAAIIGGMSLIQQQQINFTRHNEHEADRIGIQILAHAGFDPHAMASFFGRMGRALRSDGEGPPEFLRTHPVTTTRISEAKSRAQSLVSANDVAKNGFSSDDFPFIRERLRVLGGERRNELVTYYAALLAQPSKAPAKATRYGYALALTRAGRGKEALTQLEPLLKSDPNNVAFQLAAAEADLIADNRKAALRRYQELSRDFPGHRAVALAHADALRQQGDKAGGRAAVELLRSLLAHNPNDAGVQAAFARACELAGDEVRAGEAHAEAAYLNGQAEDALNLLKSLTVRADLDYYQRARIDSRIAELTPLVLELRRRGIRPGHSESLGQR